MKMGTALKQNISVQHRIWNKQQKTVQPMSFKEWLLSGIEYYKNQGFTFELLTPSLMRINRPGKTSLLRTCENFKQEYDTEYMAHFRKVDTSEQFVQGVTA